MSIEIMTLACPATRNATSRGASSRNKNMTTIVSKSFSSSMDEAISLTCKTTKSPSITVRPLLESTLNQQLAETGFEFGEA